MQTFLPYINSIQVAFSLDSKRLNKQILECYQILNVLSGRSKGNGWKNHPAVLMWKNFEKGLWNYTMHMVEEASRRGIRTENNLNNLTNLYNQCWEDWGGTAPSFWNSDDELMKVITTHRANLFKKDPLYYVEYQYAVDSPYNAPCCPDRREPCKYYWPTHVS